MDRSELTELQPTSKDCKALVPALLSFLEKFERNYERMFHDMKEEFKSAISERDEQIVELKNEVKLLRDKVKKIEGYADDSDAYTRRDTIILAGPAIPVTAPNENCSTLVQTIVKNELKYNLSLNDISTVHRLGPKPISQAPDKRSLIIKFCRRDIKRDLMMASKNQNKPVRLYVNESLTPPRRTIFNTLRQVKRLHPELVCGVSSFEGRVYAYTKNPNANASAVLSRDRRHLVNNYDMLVDFCREFVQLPINTFLNSWPY